MNKIDNVSAKITVSIEENDYKAKVENDLRTVGKKHKIDGFRPGKVPFGILKKMFGKQVLLDVVNRETYDALINYIQDNKINILGEPIVEAVKEVDFDNDVDFSFNFEVGLAPEINLNLDKSMTIPYYTIEVDEEMMNSQCEGLAKRFGKQVEGDVVDEKALVKGEMVELNADGTVKEGGINVEKAILSAEHFKSEEEKAKLIGAKLNDKVIFNPANCCDANATELASMLNLDKEVAAEVKSDFELSVSEIIVLKPAEMGQELFDGVFGADAVKTEEEYLAKVKEMIASQLVNDSNYRFTVDAEEALKASVGELELPNEFLKKWLLQQDENRNPDTIDEDYAQMIPSLQWQLIKEYVAKTKEVKVEESDVKAIAEMAARQQFAQYGMTNLPDDILAKYAEEILDNKEYRKNIVDRAVEDKLFAAIKECVTIEEKSVSTKEFNALFEAKA